MPQPLYIPRVNNNDDSVQLVGIKVAVGDRVTRGKLVAEVETDKSVSEVTADCDGYILAIYGEINERVPVGSIMMWIGESPDDVIPEHAAASRPESVYPSNAHPTAKARALLRRHDLDADKIHSRGERLTVADVEEHLQTNWTPSAAAPRGLPAEPRPEVGGERIDLSTEERGMLHTVSWHRDVAAAGYLEIEFDPDPWEQHAQRYAEEHRLMLSPLLPLTAHRLVQLAANHPKLNSTIVGDQRHQYAQVNLGFTVQAGETLYLTVVRNAATMECGQFIEALGAIQRRAIARKLPPEETQGATIGFTSMARWNVSRHVPILAPHTAVMVAHSTSRADSRAVLGATYDHRVLSGFDIVTLLKSLSQPPQAHGRPSTD